MCDSTKLLVSVDEIKNLQCCLAGRHVKCGNMSIKHQQATIYDENDLMPLFWWQR